MAAKTVLTCERISTPAEALSRFQSAETGRVPLVLIPDDRWICSCFLTVPSGVSCIHQRFGKDARPEALADPGLTCSPACNRIAYCVSQQAQTYDAPVKSCPSADNVMVDCDISLVFVVGPQPTDVKKFVYLLGALRFDEFLYAAVEEAIRHLIRNCKHTEVYELKGNSDNRVREMLDNLNKKFNKFGVVFQTCAITAVKFKRDLQELLQATTEYKSKIEEQQKKQKNLMDEIAYTQGRELKELGQVNARKIQELQAKHARVQIERQKLMTEAAGRAEVAVTKAKEIAKVNETRAESQKQVAYNAGLKKKEEMLADARARDKQGRIKAEQEAKTEIYESVQRMEVAKNLGAALVSEAEAEEKAAASLKIKREYELEMAKLEVLQELARTGNIIISGDVGEKLINTMLSDDIMGTIKLN